MSYVTSILVQGARPENIDGLNAWLRESDERGQQFERINMDAAGGVKYYVVDVWAAAFNYGPMSDLLVKLRDPATWRNSLLSVAVIVDGEDTLETFCFDYVKPGEYEVVREQRFRE